MVIMNQCLLKKQERELEPMLSSELLDKIGTLVKVDNHQQYIDEEDLRFLYHDIGLYCKIMEVLDRNNIKIKKRWDRSGILKEKVLEYQRTKNTTLIDEITDLSMYYIYSISFGLSKKYNTSFEELISPAYDGLLYSINSFDESKECPVSNYIKNNIYYYILNYIVMISKNRDNFLPLEVVDNEKYYLIDDRINEMVDARIIYEYLDILTPIQRQILELYYGFYDDDKHSMSEIGNIMNRSRQSIDNNLKVAIKKIRKKIEKNGEEGK